MVLVVDGYGSSLSVERGHLVVVDGFPSQGSQREVRFPRGRCEVDRIIVRAPAGTISIAALDWCSRMGITIAVVGSDSRLINCMIPDGAHDGPLRRAQAVSATTPDALELAQWILVRKLQSQIHALPAAAPERARREIWGCIASIEQDRTLTQLLTHEACAARAYWETFVGRQLPWREWALKRIPAHWKAISPRDSGGRNRVRDAKDPFNALLNYGYTLLEAESRVACAGEGLDPDLGYLHVDDRLRESFIYDLLEPLRVEVDRLTLQWCERVGLRHFMFIELREGVVRLDPDTARDYAHAVMPELRRPAAAIAAEFASQLRRITIHYRLIDERKARKTVAPRVGAGGPCAYCAQPLRKIGLKFCSRHCYLRHSVEVRKPIQLAHQRLHELRAQGISPGHGGEAALKRGLKIAESNRRRSLNLSPEELRVRKAAQMRGYRRARAAQKGLAQPRLDGP